MIKFIILIQINLALACDLKSPCIAIENTNEKLVSKKDFQKNEIIFINEIINEYSGMPYLYGGNGINGIDCSAFTKAVYQKLNINLSRTAKEQFFDQRFDIVKDELRPLDLIFFKDQNYHINHVAIYIGNGKMIHSSKNEGGVYISEFKNSGLWKRLHYASKRYNKEIL